METLHKTLPPTWLEGDAPEWDRAGAFLLVAGLSTYRPDSPSRAIAPPVHEILSVTFECRLPANSGLQGMKQDARLFDAQPLHPIAHRAAK
jgi:hypothetical protein